MDAAGVFILAVLTPKADKFDETASGMEELTKLIEEKEPTCLSYGLFQNKEAGKIVIIERYKDLAAAKAHAEADHMKEARAKGTDNLEKDPEVTILTAFGGFQRS